MPLFKCTARSVGALEELIEADNENQAMNIFEEHLAAGTVPEVFGFVDEEDVEPIQDSSVRNGSL